VAGLRLAISLFSILDSLAQLLQLSSREKASLRKVPLHLCVLSSGIHRGNIDALQLPFSPSVEKAVHEAGREAQHYQWNGYHSPLHYTP